MHFYELIKFLEYLQKMLYKIILMISIKFLKNENINSRR